MTKNRAPYFKVGERVRVHIKYVNGGRTVKGIIKQVKYISQNIAFSCGSEIITYKKGFIYRVNIGSAEDEIAHESQLKKHEELSNVGFLEMLTQLDEQFNERRT